MNNFFDTDAIQLVNVMDDDTELLPLLAPDEDEKNSSNKIPKTLSILPLRNTVLFPDVIIPITVGRDTSLKLINDAKKGDKIIGVVAQKDQSLENPNFNQLNTIGTIAYIIKVLKMPDDSTTVIIQGRRKFKLLDQIQTKPYFKANIEAIKDLPTPKKDKKFQALISSLKDMAIHIIKESPHIPKEATFAIQNIDRPSFLINFISSNLNIDVKNKQKMLEESSLQKRANMLLGFLSKELQMLKIKNDIQSKVQSDINKQQREYILNQQMKTIQEELGGTPMDQEVKELKQKAKNKKWSNKVQEIFDKEIKKLERMHPSAGEYGMQINYLDVLVELPWDEYTKDNFDINRSQKILDKDHYGLEKVKDRILEHLAVIKLKGDFKSPILCLWGPPGVGKTSLGKSIAKALGRKYVRMSLGGLRDEAEIRGHRKTYIGAMPGRIIQNIKRAKSSNPVFVLDEIDKVGSDFRGDPSSALLEVLDPEQNNEFYDNYLELNYDLSKVFFIATANNLSTVHPALRDRMELIDISGYMLEEKIQIAKKHLVPKQIEEHGLLNSQIKFTTSIISKIIDDYTRESGVRSLEKKIAKVIRYVAKLIAMDKEYNPALTDEDISKILGPSHSKDKYQSNDVAGVVTGLAWTSVGGEILFIETSLTKGKGKLTLTGNLGEVMKESATIALEYFKAHSSQWNIKQNIFENWNVHIHIPEGATPKDGPSAGITMFTSIVSAFTQRKVKPKLAMTGEITLRGRIIAVGGIKEKILAAKRANINTIILSIDNKKDVEDIQPQYLKGLTFQYVKEMKEVIDMALLKEKVKEPLII